MTKGKIVYISKLDAAVRQLETAIRMFFNHGDVVAIHTLAAASHQILSDLAEKQGSRGIIYHMERIREEKKDEYRTFLRKPQNFFKHSDRKNQEKETLEFNPQVTEVWLYDACDLYRQLTQETRPLLKLFNMWFSVKNPEIINDSKEKTDFLEAAKHQGMVADNRASFYSELSRIDSSMNK